MAISKDKKRYNVSLTPEVVTRFQGLLKDVGLPPSAMSTSIDDFLVSMSEVLQEARDRGTMNLEDIFRLMGRQAQLLVEEERRENEVARQKRNPVPNRKTVK